MTPLKSTVSAMALALAGLTTLATTAVAQQQTRPQTQAPQTQAPQTQATAPTPSWQRFASTDQRFSVLMPGPPTQDTGQSTSGRTVLHRFYVSPNAQATYIVQVSEPATGKARYTVPEDIAQRYAKGSGTDVVSQHAVTFAGQQGREGTFRDAKTNTEHRVVWIVANNRTYLIAAAGPEQFVESANAKRFFDSFRLNG